MSAIEKVERQFWRWPGSLSEAHADISRKDFRAALAEAWEQGKRTEARMWDETADLFTPDEEREQGRNPYEES